MRSIFVITAKDITQLVRNKMTFLFLLVMPIAFTLLFGYAFGGFSRGSADPRFPVGILDQDNSEASLHLTKLLSDSSVIRLEDDQNRTTPDVESLVLKEDLAAALVIPSGYGASLYSEAPMKLIIVSNPANAASLTIENEILRIASLVANAALTARVISETVGTTSTADATVDVLEAWKTPPVALRVTQSDKIELQNGPSLSLAHTAPGMMLQFAIASLLTSAQILVNERKTRSLQRLMTTRVARWQILAGHFLAIYIMLLIQFALLMSFGQLVLGLNYMRLPLASVLMALATTACLAALGLLIGTLAKTDEQAIIFSLIPMFVFAGLGGAWVPLEVTGKIFSAIGHLTPVAWGMDGFKNIVARGLGVESVVVPALALFGYGILFFTLAAWLFSRAEEK